jgi:hypothetical protein
MNKITISQPIIRGLLHAAGAFLYIIGIPFIFDTGFFGAVDVMPNFFGPVVVLNLLVISAAVMAVLFFLKPIMLFIEDKKKEAILLLSFTMGWFVFLTAATVLMIALSMA